MKITKSFLEQIIKEEIEKVLNEYVKDPNASWWEKLLGLDKPDLGIGSAVDITGLGAGAKAIQTAARAAKAVKTARALKRSKTYKKLQDDGQAIYFDMDFKKELYSPRFTGNQLQGGVTDFAMAVARRFGNNAGLTYARKIQKRADGSTVPVDVPVFHYKGNKEYLKAFKEIARQHGITIEGI